VGIVFSAGRCFEVNVFDPAVSKDEDPYVGLRIVIQGWPAELDVMQCKDYLQSSV
jgi:hypothetical protein